MHRFLPAFLLAFPLILSAQEQLDAQLKRLIDVYSAVQERFAEPVDPEELFYQGAIPAMLRTLDPHSAFLDSEQYQALQRMQRSTEKGFGSIVSLMPGRVTVLQTLPGSPSARSGLSPGDEIVAINGVRLATLNVQQLVALLRRSRQEKAELMVQRPGVAKLIPMTLVPAEMAAPTVDRSFKLQDGIGYIRMQSIEVNTPGELKSAIDRLGGQELEGLVLDLRNNPGGVMEAAVQMAAFFLEAGQTILWIQGRDGPKEDVKVPEGFKPYSFPLAVLIDSRTASAAELIAGAVQDHGRGVVVGAPSFGKGIVQSIFDLSEGTAVALTTAKYLTPSGRSIQRPLGKCGQYMINPCKDPEEKGKEFGAGDGPPPPEPRGGIAPDKVVLPRSYSRLEAVIEGSNSYLEFAQQYLLENPEISEDFEVTPALLNDFQLFLSERRIRPSIAEWSSSLNFIRSRLKQEIVNLKFGVEQGDRIEVRRDPQVQAAIESLR